MNGLTPAQHTQLLSGLDAGRVNKLRGMSHLEAWDVRRWLIRIFGFTGWSFEVVETALVYQNIVPVGEKLKATVVYRATGRLRIRDEAGNELAVFEDAATGDGVNMPSVGDAHDFALKTAVSQSLKRCAANLGDQFGLSLYDNGSIKPVVARVLARTGEPPVTLPVDPPVAPQVAAVADEGTMQQQSPHADDEWNTPQTRPPSPLMPKAEQKQHARMAILLKEKRGITDDNESRAAIAKMVNRPLTSRTELTKAEARSVIETLNAEPNHVQADDGNPVVGILNDLIDQANNPGQLHEAGRDIAKELERGNLTPAEATTLRARWTRRSQDLNAMAGASA